MKAEFYDFLTASTGLDYFGARNDVSRELFSVRTSFEGTQQRRLVLAMHGAFSTARQRNWTESSPYLSMLIPISAKSSLRYSHAGMTCFSPESRLSCWDVISVQLLSEDLPAPVDESEFRKHLYIVTISK